ncbi:MAG: cysteine ABC transporter substrate-binding protein [Clostridium sp.]
MKKIRKLGALLVATLVIVSSFVACGGKDEGKNSAVDQIKENGILRVGVFSDKPPFGYVDSNGENQGYDVFLSKRFAKDLLGDESKVEFVLVDAASRVEFLQSNKVDIIMANFTVTDERKEVVDFANPYMKVALGLVSADGTPINSVDDLKGKKLIVNKGTTADAYFTKNYPEIELLKYEHNTEAFEALKDGRGVALAHDNTLLFAWVRENKGYSVGVKVLGDQDVIAPAVKKGNVELQEWVNQELDKLGKEGYIKEAYEKTLLPAYGDSVKSDDVIIQ